MCHFMCFAHVRRLAWSMLLTIRSLAAIATGSMLLLGASSPAQASAELFASQCSGCHNNAAHPLGLVYNAAGNAAIIETVNALGMGASGSPADHISIATYLDSIKPTITLAQVAHDSPGTVILLGDIIVSKSDTHAFLKIIESIETVTAPTKGVVQYRWGNGFAAPSNVTYTPFPGQSGIDTWTYRGIGANGNTTIRTASVSIAAGEGSPVTNYQGMWAVPNLAEPGWGLNFTHQGDVIFVSWFTYDANGNPQWFSMTTLVQPDGSYIGSIDATTGPPYSAVPYDPTHVTHITVGTGRFTFSDANNGTFSYTLNGISRVKPLARFLFASPVPVCTFNGALAAAQAVNHTAMWAVPNLAEGGWGINFTHQGDVIFVSWFIYDQSGAPFWVSATLIKTAAEIYTGALDMTTGPPFSAVPYDPSLVTHNTVGTATVVFTDGDNGTFTYTLNGVTRTKALTRFVFVAPGTVCQ
jgi:hypothetical protein